MKTFTLHFQVPQCAERDLAVAQLNTDGEGDSENVPTFEFMFRKTDVETGGNNTEFGVSPFFTSCGPLKALGPENADLDFSIRAPTTSKNLYRVLRALQVRLGEHAKAGSRAILLLFLERWWTFNVLHSALGTQSVYLLVVLNSSSTLCFSSLLTPCFPNIFSQVRKAVLLEGSPGVGKTSLISALAAATGHEVCSYFPSKHVHARWP